MKKCDILKGKMFLFQVAALVVLSLAFFLVGCGAGPAVKAKDHDTGDFAVDFNASGTDLITLNVSNADFPSLLGEDGTGENITVEAWVKQKASTSTPGGIFGRYDARGVAMWVTSGVPKFGIRVFNTGAASSTDYSVSAPALTTDVWTHVAGVLVSEDHSAAGTSDDKHAAIDCAAGDGSLTGGNAETPHMDIYINGTLVACATTFDSTDLVTDPAAAPQGTADPTKFNTTSNETDTAEIGYLNNAQTPLIDSVSGGNFEGVIDEVRFWSSARTAAQIAGCKDDVLSATSALCNINDTSLLGYWKLNEGTGSDDVFDSSGSAINGAFEVNAAHWHDGWVAGQF